MNFLDMFKGDEMERLEKAHEKKLRKLELESRLRMKEDILKNEININKSALNNKLVLEKLESKKEQLPTKSKIFHLNIEIKTENKLISLGKILIWLGLFITVISTLITINGGINNYNQNWLKRLSFIGGITILQASIFIIALISSKIKDKFTNHYYYANMLKYTLLIVSIHYNYEFYKSENFFNNIFIMAFCICLDLFGIFVVGLGYDMKTLHYSYTRKASPLADKIKKFANMKYDNYIKKQKLKFADNETKKYLEYAKMTKDENNKIKSINDISKDTKISERKARAIHKQLLKQGLIKIKDNKSFLI